MSTLHTLIRPIRNTLYSDGLLRLPFFTKQSFHQKTLDYL